MRKSARLYLLLRRYWRQLLIVCFIVPVFGFILLTAWPGLGAQAADWLRPLIGNEAVAALETIYFTVQDTVKRWQYDTGLSEPETPWQVAPVATPTPFLPTATWTVSPTPVGAAATHQPTLSPHVTILPTVTPAPSATPTPAGWQLTPVAPLGTLNGEGIWSPYLTGTAGEVVAYRTFLQPDPDRAFAIAAIVAFDLQATALHFVLGQQEPGLPDGPRGYGRIPEADLQPNVLLATFNGGFQTTHGNFGAMADGILAVPARDGFGTVVMYEDGSVAIGAWNEDVLPTEEMIAWRQNGRLVIHNSTVNERVFNDSVAEWGGTINGDIVTWRSGLAISADRQVLYYIAGPSLSMPVLAEVMLQIGAANGLLLDINESWVHFTAIHPAPDGGLIPEPLFPEGMKTLLDRYLRPHTRDFFYVTLDTTP